MSADVFNFALKLGLVAVVIAIFAAMLRRRYSFIVRVADGQFRVTRGVLPANVREEIQTAFQQADVTRGWVAGRRRGRLTLLDFSANIPPEVRQRLRNVLNFVK